MISEYDATNLKKKQLNISPKTSATPSATNALVEGELDDSNMQKVHNTLSKYKPTTVYNLDVIISVGYRVHSQRGVQFRRWANSVLKDYLIKGYAVKNNLVQQKYDNLKALVDVMGRTMGYLDSPTDDQIRSIFDVVKDYTYALDTLDSYDYQSLGIRSTSKEYFHATYENAKEVNRSTRPGTAWTCILPSRRKQLCCSTLSSRITPSPMVIRG